MAVEKREAEIQEAKKDMATVSFRDKNVIGVDFGDRKAKKSKVRASYGSSLTNAIRDVEDIEKAKQWLLNQPQRYASKHLNLRNY